MSSSCWQDKTILNGIHIKLYGFIVTLLFSQASFALECHPKINSKLPQYIVGYGSLIDEQSKKRTDPDAHESIPVLVKGYKRAWAIYGNFPGLNTTFLSVFKKKHSSLNGVLFKPGHPKQMKQYDAREAMYCRREVNADQLKIYSGRLPLKRQIWIYTETDNRNQRPTSEYPIVQSYVDVFVRGCIQIEEKFKIDHFAKECITKTSQWSKYWVNDRIFPRRPTLYEPSAAKVDALLKEMLPEKFKQIKVE